MSPWTNFSKNLRAIRWLLTVWHVCKKTQKNSKIESFFRPVVVKGLRIWGQIRLHVFHEELRRSLPENICVGGQWPRGDAAIPAQQRGWQCVVANLSPHVIGDKAVSEIVSIFLKSFLSIGSTLRQYFGDFIGTFWHWFISTYGYNEVHVIIDSIYMVRHVNII